VWPGNLTPATVAAYRAEEQLQLQSHQQGEGQLLQAVHATGGETGMGMPPGMIGQ
jgi:hypothetical protein